jgi:hypothetical protein
MTAYLSDYTYLTAGVHYDDWDYSGGSLSDQERWIYRVSLDQRLLPYLLAKLTYQYEDYERSGPAGYDEHLWMLTLTYFF